MSDGTSPEGPLSAAKIIFWKVPGTGISKTGKRNVARSTLSKKRWKRARLARTATAEEDAGVYQSD
jgi:hypothetical protein